jgi:hypothetical protein
MLDTLWNESTGLWFTIAAGPRQRILWLESRRTYNYILLSQIWDSPIFEVFLVTWTRSSSCSAYWTLLNVIVSNTTYTAACLFIV